MKKTHVTHLKKIEYTPSAGFLFIRRSTHEFLKTQKRLSFDDIIADSIVESDFVGERFVCKDNEEVSDILEFYEKQKDGVEKNVFLKKDFKDFVEIPKDEYEHELLLFTNAMLSNKGRMMLNQPIKNNKTVAETATKQQNEKSSIDEEIDRKFEEAQKELDAMIHKDDNYSASASYYSIDDLWHSDKLIGPWCF